ncbi:hypothetical protein pipiens_020078, partial [Culex pipiens pipiens]
MCGFYEDLEKGVTLFRAGEQGRYWYAVLGGQLEVRYHGTETKDNKVIILKPEAGTPFLLLESAPAGFVKPHRQKFHVGRRRLALWFFLHIYYELLWVCEVGNFYRKPN